jgi:hypothetical protein
VVVEPPQVLVAAVRQLLVVAVEAAVRQLLTVVVPQR